VVVKQKYDNSAEKDCFSVYLLEWCFKMRK
jgi:hypothetical protein